MTNNSFVFIVLIAGFSIAYAAECKPHQFQCADGQCIFLTRQCDGVKDCDDGSDETKACANFTCLPNFMKCDDGLQCIIVSTKCDKKQDCNDYSDEIGCGVCSAQYTELRVACKDNSACMSPLQACNGFVDCDDGSDEVDCKDRCKISTVVNTPSSGTQTSVSFVNCPLGLKGMYCNETCQACQSPYCEKNPFEIKEKYYTYDGNYDANDELCVMKSTTYLEIKNFFLTNTTRSVFKEIGRSIRQLILRNITNKRMDADLFIHLRDNLKFFYVSQIDLLKFPDMTYFKNLLLFDLTYHKLKTISHDMFLGTINLQRITLSHGEINKIDQNAFTLQTKLDELFLSFNKLKANGLSFHGLRNLTTLDLSFNCIESIKNQMLNELHSLETLILVGNPISTKPIPQLAGIQLYGRPITRDFSMFLPSDINCTQFQLNHGECDMVQLKLHNILIFRDTNDSCAGVTCASNSTCVDVIPSGVCFEKQQCCGFIDDFRCLLRETNTPCSGNCRCYGDEEYRFKGFICENQVLDLENVHPSRLCVPSEAIELKLTNVTFSEGNETFRALLKRFDKLETITINNLLLPDGFDVNSFYLNETSHNIMRNISNFEFSNNPDLTAFPNLLLLPLSGLKNLSLFGNNLKSVPPDALADKNLLEILDLSSNMITTFNTASFKGLRDIRVMNLSNNLPHGYPEDIFQDQRMLVEVHGDHFSICCHAGMNSAELKICTPKSPISSCTQLISGNGLRVLIWLQAILAAFGNIVAILKRFWERNKSTSRIHDKAAHINTFLVTILAIADFIMSVYLLIIASYDAVFDGEYYKHAVSWERSAVCHTAGVLSLFSSQASVFTLTLLTLTRLASAMFPFSYRTTNTRIVHALTTIAWAIALLLAVIPLMSPNTRHTYFSSSGVCLPSWYTWVGENGWEYTTFLTLLNLTSFLVILFAYLTLVRRVYRNDRKTNTSRKSRSSTLGIRVMLIVGTDFLCWFPICIIALISLGKGGFGDNVYNVIYPWTAILLLPINSAINPILYTLLPAVNLNQIFDKIRGIFRTGKASITTLSENGERSSTTPTSEQSTTDAQNYRRKISMPFTNTTSVPNNSINPIFEDDEGNVETQH